MERDISVSRQPTEERTTARLRGLRTDLIDPAISVQRGHVVKRTGDGVLIESFLCRSCSSNGGENRMTAAKQQGTMLSIRMR